MKLSYFRRFRRASLRVLQWRLISALGLDGFHKVPGAQFRMYLEPRFRGVGSLAVYSLGLRYEEALRLLPALLGPGEGFLDCGASQGVFALYAADLVGPTGRVVAIEPQAYAARAIRLSAVANDFNHLTVRQAAVSDRDGEATFSVGDSPVEGRLAAVENAMSVQTVQLDTVLGDFAGRGVNVVKLDVEGAEELALRGAGRLLRDHAPHVIFEAYDIGDPSTLRVYDRLASAGYRFYLPQNGELVALNENREESFNILAVHPKRRSKLEGLMRGETNCARIPRHLPAAEPVHARGVGPAPGDSSTAAGGRRRPADVEGRAAIT